jgi:hypothetical protein
MLKRSILLLLSFLSVACLNAQKKKSKTSDEDQAYTENLEKDLPTFSKPDFKKQEVLTAKDEKINLKGDSLKIDSVDKVLKDYYSNKTKTKGWRIQIWDGANHLDLKNEITKYKQSFPTLGLAIHDEYDKTLFRLRIGDFTDRLEAYRFLQKIKKEFPNALLVPDEVDLSKI